MENLNQSLASLTLLRKELHKYPEVSGKEINTAKRIISFLENYSPDELITNIGTTGVLAIYHGKEAGKTILFRAELDALPIDEINTFDHRSVNKGVSHKCGHDGHMAILCGLAMELHTNRPETGVVILLFQPAEEDGTGAEKILNDPKFMYRPDFAFALHNIPGHQQNQIVSKVNTFSCAVNSLIIKLNGHTSHAAEPHMGINPALALAKITTRFNELIQPDLGKEKYCLITPIYSKMGKKAYGVSAGAAQIHFTVRSDSNMQMKVIEEKLEKEVKIIAEEFHLKHETSWTQKFYANENNTGAVDYIKKASKINNFNFLEKQTPFTWGEDFGLFTHQFLGAMFGVGSGTDSPALHNPDYDFPDEIIPTGIAMFHQISKQILNAH
ncbi:amidohydrolase [Flavobacterium sp. F-380]|uniref:Amidohydrolase n=1 Tax=Flavobacterium kayseriense TaxID=2764714 RepID=A0ABR7JAK8_9FLAO|nr:amidohydrolase [Flavobacterium kayseriense]MBC5842569.1 amidohydrolase [Flavobacterium kayseriense]MBC5849099.1 amidohydrolase [Flavobacterium kayseriense]MBU0942416.1 amidohydrolase [Bacteroidota bacterium]